jgi:mono/diheme cytochrome c family protein
VHTATTTTEIRDANVSATTRASGEELVTDGGNLFRAKGCATCHVDLKVGPSLTNLKERAATTKAGMSAAQYVRESIAAPAAFRAPAASSSAEMPTLPVDAAELDALTAYLLTL